MVRCGYRGSSSSRIHRMTMGISGFRRVNLMLVRRAGNRPTGSGRMTDNSELTMATKPQGAIGRKSIPVYLDRRRGSLFIHADVQSTPREATGMRMKGDVSEPMAGFQIDCASGWQFEIEFDVSFNPKPFAGIKRYQRIWPIRLSIHLDVSNRTPVLDRRDRQSKAHVGERCGGIIGLEVRKVSRDWQS